MSRRLHDRHLQSGTDYTFQQMAAASGAVAQPQNNMKVEAGLGIIAVAITHDAEDLALFIYRYPAVRASMQIEPPYDGALESAERGKRGAREVFVGGKTCGLWRKLPRQDRGSQRKCAPWFHGRPALILSIFSKVPPSQAPAGDGTGDFFPFIPMRRANSDAHGCSLFLGGDGPGYTLARQGYFFVRACSLFP
jgi:hypothetical protein